MALSQRIRIFDGAVAIIIGVASGSGAALGRELARRGCEVVLADYPIEVAKQVATEIQDAGGTATASEIDAADSWDIEALIYATIRRTGRLDYMFNNAEMGLYCEASGQGIENRDTMIDMKFRSLIHGVQAAYRVMLDQGFGHIVNIASFIDFVSRPGEISCSIINQAIVGLSKSLRFEVAPAGIRVSVLCPECIRTPALEQPQLEKTRKGMERFKSVSPEIFAVKALDAIARNEAIIVISGWDKLHWWIKRLFPAWSLWLINKLAICGRV